MKTDFKINDHVVIKTDPDDENPATEYDNLTGIIIKDNSEDTLYRYWVRIDADFITKDLQSEINFKPSELTLVQPDIDLISMVDDLDNLIRAKERRESGI